MRIKRSNWFDLGVSGHVDVWSDIFVRGSSRYKVNTLILEAVRKAVL